MQFQSTYWNAVDLVCDATIYFNLLTDCNAIELVGNYTAYFNITYACNATDLVCNTTFHFILFSNCNAVYPIIQMETILEMNRLQVLKRHGLCCTVYQTWLKSSLLLKSQNCKPTVSIRLAVEFFSRCSNTQYFHHSDLFPRSATRWQFSHKTGMRMWLNPIDLVHQQ